MVKLYLHSVLQIILITFLYYVKLTRCMYLARVKLEILPNLSPNPTRKAPADLLFCASVKFAGIEKGCTRDLMASVNRPNIAVGIIRHNLTDINSPKFYFQPLVNYSLPDREYFFPSKLKLGKYNVLLTTLITAGR